MTIRLVAVISLVLLTGCWSQRSQIPLPGTVIQGEVLIVCSDEVWDGEVGDTLRSALRGCIPFCLKCIWRIMSPCSTLFTRPLRNSISLEAT